MRAVVLLFVLVVFFFASDSRTSSTDLNLRTFLSLLLVTGIGGMLLYREKRRARQILDERDVASRLLVISDAFSTLNLDVLLQQLVNTVIQVIPCRGAGLILLDRWHGGVERMATAGQIPAAALNDLHRAFTQGVFPESPEQGALVFNSPQELCAQKDMLRIKEYIRKSLLIVPIRQQQIGCLILADKQGEAGFCRSDVQLLTTAAERAGVAIENARMFMDTRAAASERRALLRALISAEEQDRKHVAEEWHERFGSKLFQVLRDFRSCRELIAQRVPEVQERFAKLAAEIDAMGALVRSFTNDLHPLVLDDFGFVAALREYVARLREQAGFRVTVRAEEGDAQLPTEATLGLFRILQEAVLNIRKHAQAHNVEIAFVQEHRGVSLMIKDDGQGFNPERLSRGHYGLLYMRERAEACGGTLRVVSAQGQGTEVRVDLPGNGRTVMQWTRRERPL